MIILLRGGGDLASGVAIRLYRAGLQVVITELEKPLAIRRTVSFAEAVYTGEVVVEGIAARLVEDSSDRLAILRIMSKGKIPVIVDPVGELISTLHARVVVDGRMLKKAVALPSQRIEFLIGLGPGFTAGTNCHAVVETRRGHTLGRVIWQGAGMEDTGTPEGVVGVGKERVLRAPVSGNVMPFAQIGDRLEAGQVVAEVGNHKVLAPFKGVLRGLVHPEVYVSEGMKIGDLDPRDDPALCSMVSDKALAIGGGVMEALLSRIELRSYLWK